MIIDQGFGSRVTARSRSVVPRQSEHHASTLGTATHTGPPCNVALLTHCTQVMRDQGIITNQTSDDRVITKRQQRLFAAEQQERALVNSINEVNPSCGRLSRGALQCCWVAHAHPSVCLSLSLSHTHTLAPSLTHTLSRSRMRACVVSSPALVCAW